MSFLDDILTRKALEVEEARKHLPLDKLKESCASLPPVASLKNALLDGSAPRIIAEIKRASPSRGKLRPNIDATEFARIYRNNGAAAISVLTDGPGFAGSLDDLRKTHQIAQVPVLRKDFLIDPYQLWEAREAGADAALLIVAALGADKLEMMMAEANRAEIETLVEVHDEEEMQIAARAGAEVVGINNRNLRTFDVDPEMTFKLAPLAPEGSVPVVESGIKSAKDVRRYIEKGLRAFLIGKALVTAPNPGERLAEFVSC